MYGPVTVCATDESVLIHPARRPALVRSASRPVPLHRGRTAATDESLIAHVHVPVGVVVAEVLKPVALVGYGCAGSDSEYVALKSGKNRETIHPNR